MILEGKVKVGAYTKIDAGTVITGNVTIGHHSLIRCNVTIRGTNTIGNYVHIYDNVCIEGGRPAKSAPLPPKSQTSQSSATLLDEPWSHDARHANGRQVSCQPERLLRLQHSTW